jgi:xylitol oxidase
MQNWSKNIDFGEKAFLQPESLTELQEMIRTHKKIRVRGSAHSFNPIADTDQYAINLAKMPQVIEVDSVKRSVRVSAGLTYGELAPILDKQGWALSNLASLPHISIAGSIATGTHGSGVKNQNLANQVISLDVVDADGELKSYNQASSEFRAIVIGLGLGSVVYQYELKIEESFQVRQVIYPEIRLAELRNNFDQIMSTAYSVSYFTDWGNPQVGNLWCKFRDHELIPERIGEALPATKKFHPIPSVDPEACTDQSGIPGLWFERLPHFKLDFLPSVGEEIQTEFFVDRKDADLALGAIAALGSVISPLLWITELRTIAADDLYLSGSYQRDTLAIHFTWKKDEAIYPVIAQVEQALKPFAYRPHWGKVFTSDIGEVKSSYPMVKEFVSTINKMDLSKKFENAFTESLLKG